MNNQALLDIDGDIFAMDHIGSIFDAITAHGLRIVGSAPSGVSARLIIEETSPGVLPAECSQGWRLVSIRFFHEMHGRQRITKVGGIDIVGLPKCVLAA